MDITGVFVYADICGTSAQVKFTLDFQRKISIYFAIDFLWETTASLTPGLWNRTRRVMGSPNNNPASVSGAENSISNLLVTMAIQDFNLNICRIVAGLQKIKILLTQTCNQWADFIRSEPRSGPSDIWLQRGSDEC